MRFWFGDARTVTGICSVQGPWKGHAGARRRGGRQGGRRERGEGGRAAGHGAGGGGVGAGPCGWGGGGGWGEVGGGDTMGGGGVGEPRTGIIYRNPLLLVQAPILHPVTHYRTRYWNPYRNFALIISIRVTTNSILVLAIYIYIEREIGILPIVKTAIMTT